MNLDSSKDIVVASISKVREEDKPENEDELDEEDIVDGEINENNQE